MQNVVFAENGEQVLKCLEKFGSSEFDVVLMDIQMPVNGWVWGDKQLKKIAPELPVIGLTAHAMEEERQRCRNAGMVGHVTKPVEINKLVKTMLKNIRQNIPAKLGWFQQSASK